jgi:hypothetical protein
MAPKKQAKLAGKQPNVTTTINVPLDLYNLLEDAARGRARRIRAENAELPRGQRIGSSRPSVSAVIVTILNNHRDEIEATAGED